MAPISVLDNWWFYGPTGSGKSRLARARFEGDYYVKGFNKWWDGYTGQPTILLDDIGLDHKFLGHYLKQWADHYPFNGETKGGSCSLRPTRFVVTSNYHPRDIWGDDNAVLAPILRRFKVVFIGYHYCSLN